MIKQISFDNFKCLDGKSFEFAKLNVFSGFNGRGKSSVVQFILMLAQSLKKDTIKFSKLHLSGEYVYLGEFDEIMTDDTKKDIIVGADLLLDDEQCKSVSLKYELSNDNIMVGDIRQCIINDVDYFDTIGKIDEQSSGANRKFNKSVPQPLINQFSNIYYVSANRLGPVKFVEKVEVPENHNVGKDGSFTINTIATYKDKVPCSLNVNSSDEHCYPLLDLASKWMNYIMDGGKVGVDGNERKDNQQGKTSSVLTLGFDMPCGEKTKTFSSYNVGFGYSYILSIVVTALIAKKDSIVIVENPEAHLHPVAQLHLTELLSKLAATGVQVFIETHSEHVVNGVRLAVVRDNKEYNISSEDVQIYFFDNNYDVFPLKVKPNGRIDNWPERFFDQYQIELAEIIKLGAIVK